MYSHPHLWPLKFYFYRKRTRICPAHSEQKLTLFQICSSFSHRLRLRLDKYTVPDEEKARIEYYETHVKTFPRCFGVYQRLWLFPFYLYRPDIHGVVLDGQFFYGLPTSTCFFSLGCTFVLIERRIGLPFFISYNTMLHSCVVATKRYSEGSET